MEISFIIPVYNGEKYIKSCVTSILKWQKQPKIEILIINDGSVDNTEQICEELTQWDSRVKLFNIANSGQGIARNYGLERSTGKYIYFVDADDWVDTEQIYRAWEAAEREHADVVMGGYFRVNGTQKERVHLPGEGLMKRNGTLSQQKLFHMVKTESAFGYVWNKLYRREFLIQNHLQMDDIYRVYMEDQLFNLKVWSKNPVWYCCDYALYYYEIGNMSTTRKAEPQIQTKNLAMITELISYLEENRGMEENLDLVTALIMRTFCWSMIKNIEYEGKSVNKIKERAEAYIHTESVQRVLRMKGALRSLCQLPSLLQTTFYSLCFLLIRWRMSQLIAVMFSWGYPIMKRYVVRVVK